MVFDGVTTVMAVMGLINTLFHIFRRIANWLKRRANTVWREDNRILKIIKDYIARTTNPSTYSKAFFEDTPLPMHIRQMVEHLKQRKIQWMEGPGAEYAEAEDQRNGRYEDPGYTTDFEPSYMSGDEADADLEGDEAYYVDDVDEEDEEEEGVGCAYVGDEDTGVEHADEEEAGDEEEFGCDDWS